MPKRKMQESEYSAPAEYSVDAEEYETRKKKKKKKKAKRMHREVEIDDNNQNETKFEIHPESTIQNNELDNTSVDPKIDSDNDEDFLRKVDNSYEFPSIKNDMELDSSLVSEEPLHHLLPKLMRLNEQDLELLKEHNITVKNGRFNMIENAILSRNWKRYLDDYHVPYKTLLLGHFQYEKSNHRDRKLKKAYQKFARETQLWLRLAKDLPQRTIYQIYSRARILLAELKMAKDFDEIDRQNIIDLKCRHGDRYASFCEEFGYNPKCAREVIRNAIRADGKQLNHGEWTYKETKKLIKTVKKLTEELQIESYDGIPWSRVAQKLKRSDVQCRQRFFSKSVLATMTAMNGADNENDWKDLKLNLAKFIALLKHLDFADQNMIDWDFIKEKFSSNFFNVLLRKWRELRIRVPNYSELSFPEVVDYLYQKKVLKKFANDPEKMKEIENFVLS